jgi:hypothetical protein
METLRRIWYGPPEFIARRTTAKQRLALNFWVLVLWLGPGTLLWLHLRNALWFVGFMSVWAIWVGHLDAVAAETPVQEEKAAETTPDRGTNRKTHGG